MEKINLILNKEEIKKIVNEYNNKFNINIKDYVENNKRFKKMIRNKRKNDIKMIAKKFINKGRKIK